MLTDFRACLSMKTPWERLRVDKSVVAPFSSWLGFVIRQMIVLSKLRRTIRAAVRLREIRDLALNKSDLLSYHEVFEAAWLWNSVKDSFAGSKNESKISGELESILATVHASYLTEVEAKGWAFERHLDNNELHLALSDLVSLQHSLDIQVHWLDAKHLSQLLQHLSSSFVLNERRLMSALNEAAKTKIVALTIHLDNPVSTFAEIEDQGPTIGWEELFFTDHVEEFWKISLQHMVDAAVWMDELRTVAKGAQWRMAQDQDIAALFDAHNFQDTLTWGRGACGKPILTAVIEQMRGALQRCSILRATCGIDFGALESRTNDSRYRSNPLLAKYVLHFSLPYLMLNVRAEFGPARETLLASRLAEFERHLEQIGPMDLEFLTWLNQALVMQTPNSGSAKVGHAIHLASELPASLKSMRTVKLGQRLCQTCISGWEQFVRAHQHTPISSFLRNAAEELAQKYQSRFALNHWYEYGLLLTESVNAASDLPLVSALWGHNTPEMSEMCANGCAPSPDPLAVFTSRDNPTWVHILGLTLNKDEFDKDFEKFWELADPQDAYREIIIREATSILRDMGITGQEDTPRRPLPNCLLTRLENLEWPKIMQFLVLRLVLPSMWRKKDQWVDIAVLTLWNEDKGTPDGGLRRYPKKLGGLKQAVLRNPIKSSFFQKYEYEKDFINGYRSE
jgi:hypothetical protein